MARRGGAKVTAMHNVSPILVVIEDPAVYSEAIHLAAATGRPLVDAGADLAACLSHYDTAYAVLIDAPVAQRLGNRPPRAGVFVVGADPVALGAQPNSFVLPAQAADLLRALGTLERAAHQARAAGAVIAVLGAAGGAGTSTVGASISRAAGGELAPTLVDAHRYSGGLDLLVGVEEAAGARWGEITIGEGAIEREDLRRALPQTRDGIAILTCSRTTVSDPFVLDAATLERTVAVLGTAGVTVVDCPVGLVPRRCDLALVVTPGEVRAAAAATRIAAELAAHRIPAAILARRRAWSGLSSAEIERVTRSRVIAEVPEIARLTRAVETTGLPARLPRPLAAAAKKVLAEVGQ